MDNTNVCMHACMHVYINACIYMYIYIYTYMHACMYIFVYICMYICMYMHVFMHVFMHICVYVYSCMYKYVYVVISYHCWIGKQGLVHCLVVCGLLLIIATNAVATSAEWGKVESLVAFRQQHAELLRGSRESQMPAIFFFDKRSIFRVIRVGLWDRGGRCTGLRSRGGGVEGRSVSLGRKGRKARNG